MSFAQQKIISYTILVIINTRKIKKKQSADYSTKTAFNTGHHFDELIENIRLFSILLILLLKKT